jgi:hypothetical protein
MKFQYRLSQKGKQRAMYLTSGLWVDPKSRRIHYTVPGLAGAHWSYGPAAKEYPALRTALQAGGRWLKEAA